MLFVLIRTTDRIELVSLTLIVKHHVYTSLLSHLTGFHREGHEAIKPEEEERDSLTEEVEEKEILAHLVVGGFVRVRPVPVRQMCCRWEIWGWSGMYLWKVQGVRCWPNDYSNKHIHCFGFRGTVNLNHKLTFWGGTFLYWTEVWTLLFCPVQHFVVFSLWRKNIEINYSSNTNTLLADKRSGPKQVLELSHLRGQRGGNWWSGICVM